MKNSVVRDLLIKAKNEIPILIGVITAGVFLCSGTAYAADDVAAISTSGLPSRYNVEELKKLPPIRDQYPFGACWAFSGIGAIEADLIHDGKVGTSVDLSELQIVYYHGHSCDDPKDCHDRDRIVENSGRGLWADTGGSPKSICEIMMNGIGAIKESDMPYLETQRESWDYTVPDEYAYGHNVVGLENAYTIKSTDRTGIKSAILSHGAVSAGMRTDLYDDNKYYNKEHNAYYCDYEPYHDSFTVGEEDYSNHGIMIVGWDDDFPASYFKEGQRPSQNGAWLVRNSWGREGYCLEGYFWMSYEDKGFGLECIAFDANMDPYDNAYCYARTITPRAMVTVPDATIRFNVGAGEYIKAVSFETQSTDFRATATVTAGTQRTMGHVDTNYAGYYTIDLDEDIFTASATTVTVTINFSKDVKLLVEDDPEGEGYIGGINYYPVCESGGVEVSYWDDDHEAYDPYIALFTNNPSHNSNANSGLFSGDATIVVDTEEEKTLEDRFNDEIDMAMLPPLFGWCQGLSGRWYWYEDGIRQGTYDDKKGVMGDNTIRGREIYDPGSNEWYWLDAIYNGAKAVGKEVWMPYVFSNEDGFSDDEIQSVAAGCDAGLQDLVIYTIKNKKGKWVRYDENGAMLKGWVTIEGALAEKYPDQVGNTYYYDTKTGLMARGFITLGGTTYHFDEVTGVLQ
ncbi:MAG: hypothetical protein IJ796_08730 [Lachnospiraceae bacterium]|nr:hypothetical protein [Lachnospiraceae bacterium]